MVDVGLRDHLRAVLAVHDTAAAVLRGICELCVEELGVTGARVQMLDATCAGGGGALVCSTDALGLRLEDLVTTSGAGPCIDAFALGRPVLVPDLNADCGYWPGFTVDAIAAGVAAVFSFPLQVGDIRLGVLELHRETAGSLTSAQMLDALLMADAATGTIFRDLHGVAPMTLSRQVDIHTEVHQATGMVAVQLKADPPEALARIRGHAFAHHMTLTEVARDIVGRRLRLTNRQ